MGLVSFRVFQFFTYIFCITNTLYSDILISHSLEKVMIVVLVISGNFQLFVEKVPLSVCISGELSVIFHWGNSLCVLLFSLIQSQLNLPGPCLERKSPTKCDLGDRK